ncbi:MAG: hypothetical protein FJW36_24220 [Acidobacteria bacterium]|nr:hypothetical protein [Acidobacteriota bacterium]
MADRIKLAVWAILVVAYVKYKAPVIWLAEWSHDDLMNAYRAMTTSYAELFKLIAFFWQPTSLFRPLGELFYKVFWDQFGFSPMPWRLACSAFLIGNGFLVGHIAMKLSKSLSVGLLATAIASYHPLWTHLYLNTGTIFEIMACTFVYAGFAYYLEFEEPWGATLLLILGLNAKESAIVLPVLIVLYEWIYNRRTPWLYCGLSAITGLAFIIGRVYGPEGLSSVGGYQPTYNLATYLARFQGYFGPMILAKQASGLWIALLLLLREKMAYFAVAFFPIAILPLAFVPDRGLEGAYIACISLPLALSALLLKLPKENHRLVLAAVCFALLVRYVPSQWGMDGWDKEFVEIRQFRESLQSQIPQMPPKVQIRFVSEPFTADYPWASTFIVRLLYKNTDLLVVSPNNVHTKGNPEAADFASFEWRGDRLYRLR